MSRTKAIPDATVFAAIRQMLVADGDRAVSFAANIIVTRVGCHCYTVFLIRNLAASTPAFL